ncbi:MAG: anhydro-N-acetylmuramic acid kinase [Bacteroidetes bacterium]|nr:anhydro-N-acetylmuramic acid kinase [Bacteroidota bacterium]
MINTNAHYSVIGLMSGTSLDGVDIAFCRFFKDKSKWTYEIVHGETISYTDSWKQILLNLEKADALTFQQTHVDYGIYLGTLVSYFIKKYDLKPDFVSSHGHTIFHQPEKKITVQIGAGSAIAAECNLPVVYDFRSLDVALGGQGAPLVPVGDKLLFSEFDFCLNLGGFANVSYQHNDQRIAFDISPVNIVMNSICAKLGKEYDNGGELARTGTIHEALLQELNELPFYKLPLDSPKSLGKEWVVKNIDSLLKKNNLSEADVLRTFCEHAAMQIAKALNNKPVGSLLVTGGGVYNSFLMEKIKYHVVHQLAIPDKDTIEFKEALIFAFLGVLRMCNEVNCLKSVTGAKRDNIGGAVVHPTPPLPKERGVSAQKI